MATDKTPKTKKPKKAKPARTPKLRFDREVLKEILLEMTGEEAEAA